MCPNRCDPTKIPREEIDVHVQALCPSATVSCTFKDAGCKHKVGEITSIGDLVFVRCMHVCPYTGKFCSHKFQTKLT